MKDRSVDFEVGHVAESNSISQRFVVKFLSFCRVGGSVLVPRLVVDMLVYRDYSIDMQLPNFIS